MSTFEGGRDRDARRDEAQAVRELRVLGIDTDRALRRDDRMWDYGVGRQGCKYHLGSILASAGSPTSPFRTRSSPTGGPTAATTTSASQASPEVITPRTDFEDVASFIYFVRVRDAAVRAGLVAHLEARGIATGVHFQGAHGYAFYRSDADGVTCRRPSSCPLSS